MEIGDIVETKYPMELRDQILGMGHRGEVIRHHINDVWFVQFMGKQEAVTVHEREVTIKPLGRLIYDTGRI